jgi:hypothetical protein
MFGLISGGMLDRRFSGSYSVHCGFWLGNVDLEYLQTRGRNLGI